MREFVHKDIDIYDLVFKDYVFYHNLKEID